ncbi:MAG: hypothetical protein ACFFFC_00290 [Candidatus Thorarchaeota archaeon]
MDIQGIMHDFDVAKLRGAIHEKRASFWEPFKKALIAGAGTAATATIAAGTAWGAESLRDKIEKGRAYKGMVSAAPGLSKNRDANRVQMTFNTLWNLNKDLAKDPLTAGSFVERSMQRADIGDTAGSYIDIDTARNILKARGREERPITKAFTEGAISALTAPEQRGKDYSREAKLERYKAQLREASQATNPDIAMLKVRPPF